MIADVSMTNMFNLNMHILLVGFRSSIELKPGLITRWLCVPVELGKRFFPRCSKELDQIMDDETELASLGGETSTEKKRRFHDLQDVLQKAFSEDKEENDRSARSSSSSSTTSMGAVRPRR
jgi:regulatory protein NPR1